MLVEARVWTLLRTDRGSAVLVKPLESTRVVPIFIDTLEIRSIRLGLGKVSLPRPLSHDLMLSIFDKLHLVVDRVEINDLQDGIFYARIIARQGMKKYVFDSRPSDALSIAVRVECPVYIAEFIVDETGIPETMFTEAPEISPTELEELMSVMDEEERTELESEVSPGSKSKKEENPLTLIREQLEQRLAAAVAVENYEEAAALRDEINDIDRMSGEQSASNPNHDDKSDENPGS